MTKLISGKKYLMGEIKSLLHDLLQEAKAHELCDLERFEIECEEIDILAWISSQNSMIQTYFCDRDEFHEAAGLGSVFVFKGTHQSKFSSCYDEIKKIIHKDSAIKFYGGFSFHQHLLDPEWSQFGSFQWVLPRFEFQKKNEKFYFVFHLIESDWKDDFHDFENSLTQLSFDIKDESSDLKVVSQTKSPSMLEWEKIFSKVSRDLYDQNYEKIVLARKKSFAFKENLKAFDLLKQLKQKTKNCFHFCFSPDSHFGFIGASPERLFRRIGNRLESEAIAGTMGRGKNEMEDLLIEKNLLSSLKNEREHRYVVDFILRQFRKICDECSYDKNIQLLKLVENQHLITRFRGRLQTDVSDLDVIRHLHPTPAVGGYPTGEAIRSIQRYESFDRGWFAGGFGYLGYEESQIVVGIRSGFVHENKVDVFAGAGLVEGSEAEDEWNEMGRKMRNFSKVFN